MEKKLTDEEIVKALECCVKNDCEKCPYTIKGFDCVISKQAENDFIDLIHRLQEENKGLKEERENMQAVIFGLEEARLQAIKDTAKAVITDMFKEIEGYERIDRVLERIAERYGVEVE